MDSLRLTSAGIADRKPAVKISRLKLAGEGTHKAKTCSNTNERPMHGKRPGTKFQPNASDDDDNDDDDDDDDILS